MKFSAGDERERIAAANHGYSKIKLPAMRNGLAPPPPKGAPVTSENSSGKKLAKNLNWPKISRRLCHRP